mmetsp:Transcript_93382/g.247900  ORF Transcript_93382/g.247900 Transcript_93382/m.247900 type:complete len:216 (-) Transcript_93382:532-1179(-)
MPMPGAPARPAAGSKSRAGHRERPEAGAAAAGALLALPVRIVLSIPAPLVSGLVEDLPELLGCGQLVNVDDVQHGNRVFHKVEAALDAQEEERHCKDQCVLKDAVHKEGGPDPAPEIVPLQGEEPSNAVGAFGADHGLPGVRVWHDKAVFVSRLVKNVVFPHAVDLCPEGNLIIEGRPRLGARDDLDADGQCAVELLHRLVAISGGVLLTPEVVN